MKLKLADRMIRFLLGYGATEVKSRSTKYRRFDLTRPDGTIKSFWVGKNGALRVGSIVLADSISMTDTYKSVMYRWERANGMNKDD